MTLVKEIVDLFEESAPFSTQEGYDNSGLIIGKNEGEVKKILLSVDTTEDVIQEALDSNCQLVVSHHPIIFRGMKRFNNDGYVQRTVEKAIKGDIAVLAVHTNLDNASLGVNRMISDKIGLKKNRILKPKTEGEDVGAGMIGELDTEVTEQQFLDQIKKVFNARVVRHTEFLGRTVKKIAVCGGAGSFLLEDAKRLGADAYLSGDFKYHEFFDADGQILILDPGHFESEQFTVQLFKQIISEKFPNIALQFSEVGTNPIRYFF